MNAARRWLSTIGAGAPIEKVKQTGHGEANQDGISPDDAKSEQPTQERKPSKDFHTNIIVALLVIVVIGMLIIASLGFSPPPHLNEKPYLQVVFSPSEFSTTNGSILTIYAFVYFMNSSEETSPMNISRSVSCSISMGWMTGFPDLGDINRKYAGEEHYWEIKSRFEGNSDISWTFSYRDPVDLNRYWVNKTTPVSVGPAVLDFVAITPPSVSCLQNTNKTFTAEAYLTNQLQVNASFVWSLENASSCTISNSTGPETVLRMGNQNIYGKLKCNASYGGKSVSSYAPLYVLTMQLEQTSTRIYDLFNVPLRDFWNDRYQEEVLSATFPVAYAWHGAPPGNDLIYSNCRMNVTAKNISRANTSVDPVYVPITNPDLRIRGGNVKIDWRGKYLTYDEILANYHYNGPLPIWYDSWYFDLNGTVTMDKTAARMILNMTNLEFANFEDWKAEKFNSFKENWSMWLQYEMNSRWAIRFAYEWDGNTLYENYSIEKVGDEIVFRINDILSWGLESLLGRWWRSTFLSFEGWPDDVHFTANIGPLWSCFNLDTCMEYSLVAKTSTRGNQTCWAFENEHADRFYGSSSKCLLGNWVNYSSELNPYGASSGYWCSAVSNNRFNNLTSYDYVPSAWNLSARDVVTIEWPNGGNILGYVHNGTGINNVTIVGHVDPLWIEPIPGEALSNVDVNWTSHQITIKGPFDAWNWSRTTHGGTELRENWTRLENDVGRELLPRGCPYIEFVVNDQTATQHHPIPVLSVTSNPILSSNYTWPLLLDSAIQLNSSSFDIAGGSIISYHWEFGDGTSSDTIISSTTHTWTGVERYVTVALTVTDNDSLSSTITRTFHLVSVLP